MAALHLHNAIFSLGESQEPIHPGSTLSSQHRHKLSSQSNMTTAPSFRTSLSEFSHPTDSLLHPGTSGSPAYADLLSRQPAHPSGPQPGWDLGLSLIGDPPTINERRDTWERAVKMRLKRLSLTKGMLELLMVAWATYNTVRYIVAFESYSAFDAQAASLILGASTTLSISLLTASWLLSAFSPHLISPRISHRLLHFIRRYLRYLAAFFLLTPAVVAFVLVFAWRNTADSDMHFRGRCHWDIDVVWSGPGSHCEHHAPAWGTWLAASIVRLIFTLIVLVTYYLTSNAYSYTRRPSQIHNSRFRQRGSYKPSYSIIEPSALPPTIQTVMTSRGTLTPSTPVSLTLTQQASSSTLVDYTRTRKNSSASAGPTSIRSSQSRGSLFNLSSAGHISHVSSDPDTTAPGEGHNHPGLGHLATSVDDYLNESNSQPTDADLYGFTDRFRSLVNQVSREVDDGLDIVRRESIDYQPSPSYAEHHTIQAATTADELERLLYSDEFGIAPAPVPAPEPEPEDHIIILGGYVRRMSTIESIGSREMGSASSVHRNATLMSSHSSSGHTQQSRPPTRANTLTNDAVAEPPSRNSSLTASSMATGGHGGGSNASTSYHSGNKVFPENSDLLESPIENGTSMQA